MQDGDNGPGDKRMMLGTGPFNMLPGDVAHFVYTIAFALPAKGGEADGTYEDLTGFKKLADNKNVSYPLESTDSSLVGKIKFAMNSFYASQPNSVNDYNSDLSLYSVYPNPVANSANIKYHLSKTGNIRLALYNQLGQELVVIRSGIQEAGDYNLQYSLEKNKINNGIYFLRLQNGSQTITRQIIVLK